MYKYAFVVSYLLVHAYGAAVISPKENSTITITLYATDLSGCDALSACDASVTIRCQSIYSDWKICGETSKKQDDNNPVWDEVFTLDHEVGASYRWRLDMVDHDLTGTKPIGSWMIVVDDFSLREDDLLRNDTPDNRGTLWVQRHRSAE